MKNTLEKLNEVKVFLNTLLDSSNEEAIDLLVNYGEDIEETLQEAIKSLKRETPRSNNPKSHEVISSGK
jgi:hypothetical protein